MCSPSPSSLSSIVEGNLAKADCVSTSADEVGTEIVIGPHEGTELYLQVNNGDC